ncbi:hypothetical protein [Synechococcus sp. BS55D]|uniref:hypothetical protein n=1 Tax=Synechococcus sp. BS55D TaxID=2055943 RepID=UPI001039E8ED|nr:hypothetical protein [Synechococcus sp. BS55D]TCD55571.1 hypothetical protein CWE16_09465 [Synechococcus sp. BS55D]
MITITPRRTLSLLLGMALVTPQLGWAGTTYVPFPTKEEFRAIQLLAYDCSRENSAELCDRTRSLADPLMDHPRLPAACKDAIWDLLQTAKPAASNGFQRRDSIDKPARRLTVVCADPVKPKPTGPKPGSLTPSQT